MSLIYYKVIFLFNIFIFTLIIDLQLEPNSVLLQLYFLFKFGPKEWKLEACKSSLFKI